MRQARDTPSSNVHKLTHLYVPGHLRVAAHLDALVDLHNVVVVASVEGLHFEQRGNRERTNNHLLGSWKRRENEGDTSRKYVCIFAAVNLNFLFYGLFFCIVIKTKQY